MTVRPTDIGQLQQAVLGHDHVIPIGARTAPSLSCVSDEVHRLDMTGLTGVKEYDPGEFVISAWAGTPVAEVQAALEKHRQYLPFDPPWIEAGATLGGTVAAGLNGPGRLRYGGIRDFLIGVRFVDGQGKLISGGGKVVKNAAGFDLAKLMVGSQGRLGVLAELTLKVFPQPRQRKTLTVACRNLDEASRIISELARGAWDLEALELEPPSTLKLRIAGHAETLTARARRLRESLDCPVDVMDRESEADYWRSVNEFAWREDGDRLVKVPLTAGRIPDLEDAIASDTVRRRYGVAGNIAWLSWPPERSIDELHTHLTDLGLSGLVIDGDVDHAQIGVAPAHDVHRRVKTALDPMERFPE